MYYIYPIQVKHENLEKAVRVDKCGQFGELGSISWLFYTHSLPTGKGCVLVFCFPRLVSTLSTTYAHHLFTYQDILYFPVGFQNCSSFAKQNGFRFLSFMHISRIPLAVFIFIY